MLKTRSLILVGAVLVLFTTVVVGTVGYYAQRQGQRMVDQANQTETALKRCQGRRAAQEFHQANQLYRVDYLERVIDGMTLEKHWHPAYEKLCDLAEQRLRTCHSESLVELCRSVCVVRAKEVFGGGGGGGQHQDARGIVDYVWTRRGAQNPQGKPLVFCTDGGWLQTGK